MGEDTRHPEPLAHEQPADDPDLGLALITARALAPLLLDDASRDNLVGVLPPAPGRRWNNSSPRWHAPRGEGTAAESPATAA